MMSNSLMGQPLSVADAEVLYEEVIDNIANDLMNSGIEYSEFSQGGSLRRKEKEVVTDVDLTVCIVESKGVDYRKKKWSSPKKLKDEIRKIRDQVFEVLKSKNEEHALYEKLTLSGLGIHFLFKGTQVDVFLGIPANWLITKLFWSGSRYLNEERMIKGRYKELYITPTSIYDTRRSEIITFKSEREFLNYLNIKIPLWVD